MRILEHTTISYRRLPGPVLVLAALVLIPLGLLLGLIVLVPALILMIAAWVYTSVGRLAGRAMAAARIDREGRRNVRVRAPEDVNSIGS